MLIRQPKKALYLSLLFLAVGVLFAGSAAASKVCMNLDGDGPIFTIHPDGVTRWSYDGLSPNGYPLLTIPASPVCQSPGCAEDWGWRCHSDDSHPGQAATKAAVTDIDVDLGYFLDVVFPNGVSGVDCLIGGEGWVAPGVLRGTLIVRKRKRDAFPRAIFSFQAVTYDGTGIQYHLTLTGGDFVPGYHTADGCQVDGWPVAVGCVAYVSFSNWTLESEGEAGLKNYSCTGSGSFTDSAVVSVYQMLPRVVQEVDWPRRERKRDRHWIQP